MQIDINALVRQILSDLTPKLGQGVAVEKVTEKVPEKTPRISAKVVTLEELKKLGNVKRLIVPEKAVITPAVRDEIHKRNIEIVTEKAKGRSLETGKLKVWLALHLQKKEPAALFDFLAKNYELEKAAFECILQTMDAAAEKLAVAPQQTLCAVLTDYSAAAMCIANRQASIRAVLGTDPALIKTDADQIGANLLVVDPVRCGPYKTQSLLKIFVSEGVRNVPKSLFSRYTVQRQ